MKSGFIILESGKFTDPVEIQEEKKKDRLKKK